MRKIAILLVVLALVGWGWSSLLHERDALHRRDHASADDDPRDIDARQPGTRQPGARQLGTRDTGAPAESYELPPDADVPTLVEFVRQLRDELPIAGTTAGKNSAAALAAIRQASQRILQLDVDPASADHQFARREIISLDIEQLADIDEPAARQAAFKRLCDELLQRPRDAEDAELALDLVALGEDVESPQFLRPHVERLAAYYAASRDEGTQFRTRLLQGVHRRLGSVGQVLDLTGRTVAGEPFDLGQWKGKVVVVDFWADWVSDNLDEWSNLKRNYRAFHGQGLEVVSIHLGETRDQMELSLQRQRVPWTTLYDDEHRAQHPAAVNLGIVSLPRRLLIDRAGKVVSIDVRGRNLRRQLRKLLGPPETPLAGPLGFPAFNSGEVIERLCDAGEDLLARGGFTTAAALRPGLANPRCKLALPPASDQPLDDEQLFRRMADSVFVVGTLYKGPESDDFDLSLATAFAVTADGVLSTNYHVFDDDPEALVALAMDARGQTFPVDQILAADEASDTCLLRVRTTGLKPLAFGNDAPPGSRARIVSHPGDSFFYFSAGQVCNYETDDDGIVWMNVTADFGQGSSGGPVVDACGNVIGQVSRTATMYAGDPLDPSDDKPPPHVPSPRHHHRRGGLPEMGGTNPDIPAWLEPQMVFRSCVPTMHLRKLVEAP